MRTDTKPQANMLMLTARIQPIDGELKKAASHLLTVRTRLNKSFDISKFNRIGSHTRKTAIRWYSDMDVMVVLRRNEAKWGGSIVNSSTVLRKIREDLEDRYINTAIRTDEQAVVVSFGQGQHSLDVVPAIFHTLDLKKGAIYWIPDGSGGWIETAPDSHNRYFSKAVERSGNKLPKVVQLIKWWKYSRANSIPLNTFHVDMLLASSDICVGIKSYAQCLYETFNLLAQRECRGLQDPLGISGVLYAANTRPQIETLSTSVNHALLHSRSALVAEAAGDFYEANRQWNIVFNGQF